MTSKIKNDLDKDFRFNPSQVVAEKTDHSIRNGFGGVMIWHFNCDLPSVSEGSMLRAIYETANKYY